MNALRARSSRLVPLAVAVGLVVYPLVMPRFWVLSIAAQSLIVGIAVLSLTFLAGYGGMVSLAQTALAGVGGYVVAILTVNAGMPTLGAAAVAVVVASLVGLAFGIVSVRTQGLYFLMLTLALAVGFFYLVLQNYEIFNGHRGIANVLSPVGTPRASPELFYYLCLSLAVVSYAGIKYLARTPFGLALQGIRDNPRRMCTLGYSVGLHRVVAFGVAGLIAGVAGVLGVWYRGSISPGSVDLTRTIDVLIAAVVGGLAYPAGAFLGSLLFVLVQTFASSVVLFDVSFDERFNTLIGLSFLLVVLFSPDGLIGIAHRLGRVRKPGSAGRGLPVATAVTVPAATVAGGFVAPPGDPPPRDLGLEEGQPIED